MIHEAEPLSAIPNMHGVFAVHRGEILFVLASSKAKEHLPLFLAVGHSEPTTSCCSAAGTWASLPRQSFPRRRSSVFPGHQLLHSLTDQQPPCAADPRHTQNGDLLFSLGLGGELLKEGLRRVRFGPFH